MAVDVAGERYLTPTRPAVAPPSLPTPKSPKRREIVSRMSFERRAGVRVSGVGRWMERIGLGCLDVGEGSG